MLSFLVALGVACEGWLLPTFIGPPLPQQAVSGTVLVGRDRSPCRWAYVMVEGTNRSGGTDQDGKFRIEMVPAGNWTVRVFVPERETLTIPVIVPATDIDLGEAIVDENGPSATAPIAVGSHAGDVDLVAAIRAPALRVGLRAQFDVRIANRGARPVTLVRTVDGSDRSKSPRVRLVVTGPPGGISDRLYVGCGNTSGVRPEDFVSVSPGKEFDPYAGGWPALNLEDARFVLPGTYTATFHYVTTDRQVRAWVRGPCDSCDIGPGMRRRIEEVPAVDLTATTTFEVKP